MDWINELLWKETVAHTILIYCFVIAIGVGYTIAYPFGVIGIIITMLTIQKAGRINIAKELRQFNQDQHPVETFPDRISIRVSNP